MWGEERNGHLGGRTSRKKERAGGRDEWDEGLEARSAPLQRTIKGLIPAARVIRRPRRDADRELRWFIDAVPLGILRCG